MSMINNDWLDAIRPEFSKPYYRDSPLLLLSRGF